MLKNARRMLHLTNQLLDFRKVQNNKMILKIREIDIVSFTKEIFDSFVPLASHKGIIYSFESQYESFILFADPTKLDTIIYNIISNGIKFTKTGNPDIIITDIMMPDMDGMEMTRILKEDFSTSHIPVIMLTSKTDVKDQIAGIETGAEAYIVKPFNIEYLKTVAGNLINQRAKVLARFLGNKSLDSGSLKVNNKDAEILDKVVLYIEENYNIDFAIDDLAEYCNVSRTVFYNKIKGLTGLSPIEFTRKIKLKIAAELLKKGYNVSEAAYRTGFSDVKYFSRLFKEQFGFPPSRYKSENQ